MVHASSSSVPTPPGAALPKAALQIGTKRIVVEVAANEAARAYGLMFRESMPRDHGMLFVFKEASQVCFWMKNTLIPLTIAFIDANANIINLADMEPQSLDTHCALGPAQYALEMNRGWFAQNRIAPGTKVLGLPVLSK